jgi:toxin CcdB
MAQFDVFENPNEETNQTVPYLLDVQADLLDALSTRVVVPLVAASAMGGEAVKHLNPEFKIKNATVFLSTAELAGIPVRSMGEKVTSLKDRRHEIMAALDFLLTGF